MYRLLVVDDEEIIADGLVEILSRLGLPELDICKAYSGVEALEWLNGTRIDIVLSDIRMPEMNGLELMDIIRGNWPRCRIIFLTGYNDFDAVYKSIQAWGVKYLLKTEGYLKVIDEVHNAVRELDDELRTADMIHQAKEQRNTLETLAHGDYFRHMLLGTEQVAASTREEDFNKLAICLNPSRPVLPVAGSLIQAKGEKSYAGRQEAMLAAKFVGDHFLRDRTNCVGIIDRFGDLLWLIQPQEGHWSESEEAVVRFLEGTLELVQTACTETLGLNAAFTIYGTPVEWDSLADAYDRLRQLHHIRIGDGVSMVMTLKSGHSDESGPVLEQVRIEKFELLAGHLEGGRSEAFMDVLQEIVEPVRNRRVTDCAQAMELYYSAALVMLSYVNRKQLNEQVPLACMMRFDAHASWEEAFDYLTRTADTLFALRRSGEDHRAEGAMREICVYIQDHLEEDLSLVRLSKRFHFNPSYLSRLFKQERGVNLSSYIEDARVRRAKELLAKEEFKVLEIGFRVGYESPHSFTRFFKKATGVSPQEYREAARDL